MEVESSATPLLTIDEVEKIQPWSNWVICDVIAGAWG